MRKSNNSYRFFCLALLIFAGIVHCFSQNTILFYNTENLFDCFDDSLKNDNEFLPEADKQWTQNRYYKKLEHIYQVISVCGNWDAPAIVGLCEVENRYCLEGLCLHTNLSSIGYEIVHYESADFRGIDVALLYRPDRFRLISSAIVRPKLPNNIKTRDILYVFGQLGTDSVHIFVNHWPSRRGGQVKSEPKRMAVAQLLAQQVDSIVAIHPQAQIIAMGDFNDQASDRSIELLRSSGLHSLIPDDKSAPGSLQYRGQWFTYDQFLVSLPVEKRANGKMRIGNFDFLLQKDPKALNSKPFRTYLGPHYSGGYSDHLPVYFSY